MSAPFTTQQLSQLIVLKHDTLAELHALAEKQLAAVAADDIDRLLSLLATKQPLVNQLQRIERALQPFRQQDPEGRVWESPLERRRCQAIAERANELLHDLLRMEQQGERELQVRRDQTSLELQQSGRAVAAQQAYRHAPPVQSHALDLTSET